MKLFPVLIFAENEMTLLRIVVISALDSEPITEVISFNDFTAIPNFCSIINDFKDDCSQIMTGMPNER